MICFIHLTLTNTSLSKQTFLSLIGPTPCATQIICLNYRNKKSVEGGPYLRYNDAPINKWYYQNDDLSIYSSGSGKLLFQCLGYLFLEVVRKGGFMGGLCV